MAGHVSLKISESAKAMMMFAVLGALLTGVWMYRYNHNQTVRPGTQPSPRYAEFPLLTPPQQTAAEQFGSTRTS